MDASQIDSNSLWQEIAIMKQMEWKESQLRALKGVPWQIKGHPGDLGSAEG